MPAFSFLDAGLESLGWLIVAPAPAPAHSLKREGRLSLVRVLDGGAGEPIDPHHVAELELPPVMGLDADPLDRSAVALVGEEDFLAAMAPILAPLAQRQ